jgi:hypothetical protein
MIVVRSFGEESRGLMLDEELDTLLESYEYRGWSGSGLEVVEGEGRVRLKGY